MRLQAHGLGVRELARAEARLDVGEGQGLTDGAGDHRAYRSDGAGGPGRGRGAGVHVDGIAGDTRAPDVQNWIGGNDYNLRAGSSILPPPRTLRPCCRGYLDAVGAEVERWRSVLERDGRRRSR
jgi:hypothetical protein